MRADKTVLTAKMYRSDKMSKAISIYYFIFYNK